MGSSHDTILRTQYAYYTFFAQTNPAATDADHLCDYAVHIYQRLGVGTYKLTGDAVRK